MNPSLPLTIPSAISLSHHLSHYPITLHFSTPPLLPLHHLPLLSVSSFHHSQHLHPCTHPTLSLSRYPNSVAVNRVATFKELDTDLLRHAAFSTLDDIDLRLLTSCLAPESEVREVSVYLPSYPWIWKPWDFTLWLLGFGNINAELWMIKEWRERRHEVPLWLVMHREIFLHHTLTNLTITWLKCRSHTKVDSWHFDN